MDLTETAAALVQPGKGILAADESVGTMNKRLSAEGIEPDTENRRQFRELIVGTSGLGDYVSGVILFDETLRQSTQDGVPLHKAASANGILSGIKVDIGAKPLAGTSGETVTEGLDGLRDRLAEYAALGARFAKWRAVIRIGDGMPSEACLRANAHALARYAALCQEAGLVPIVEPEVLGDGAHDIEQCEKATGRTLLAVFDELRGQRVLLEGIVLKPNMVLPGLASAKQAGPDAVADSTLRCLLRTVPAAVGGIAFLSGGQPDEAATRNLNAMNRRRSRPWPLSFSFGRALLAPTLSAWAGQPGNVSSAQAVLLHRARCNSAATLGRYDTAMEHAA